MLIAISFIKEDYKDYKRCLWLYGAISWYLSSFDVAELNYSNILDAFISDSGICHDIGDAQIRVGKLSNAYESFEKGKIMQNC